MKFKMFLINNKKKIIIVSLILLIYVLISSILTISQIPVITLYNNLEASKISLVNVTRSASQADFKYLTIDNQNEIEIIKKNTKKILTNFYLRSIRASGYNFGSTWIVLSNNNIDYFVSIDTLNEQYTIRLSKRENNHFDDLVSYIKVNKDNEYISTIINYIEFNNDKFNVISNIHPEFTDKNHLPFIW